MDCLVNAKRARIGKSIGSIFAQCQQLITLEGPAEVGDRHSTNKVAAVVEHKQQRCRSQLGTLERDGSRNQCECEGSMVCGSLL